MADDDDGRSSPPLARGSYNINFDELDDSIDPFKPSKGLMNSPDKELDFNPFQTKTKLSSSPPTHNHISDDFNPFQTKSKLGQSPPNESGFIDNAVIPDSVNSHDDSAESFKTATDESPVKCNTGTFVKKKKKSPTKSPAKADNDLGHEGQGDGVQDGGAEIVQPKLPEKKPSPKKSTGIKKPKAKSKFKPPANFGVQDTEDVMIFAPPTKDTAENSSDQLDAQPSKSDSSQDLSQEQDQVNKDQNADQDQVIQDFPPPPTDSEINPETNTELEVNPETNIEIDTNNKNNEITDNNVVNDIDDQSTQNEPRSCQDGDVSNQFQDFRDITEDGRMMDSVHDFGAGEMPMENNEEFVPASEAFNEDDEAWQMMEKMNNEENALDGRESLSAFDPLADVPDKVTKRRGSEDNVNSNSLREDEDLILMNTPPSIKSQARHPAARALKEQVVEGDNAAPRDAQVIDRTFSPAGKGSEIKRTGDESEKYFDALEYPYGSKSKGDNDLSRMNAANKKYEDGGQDSVVQLVQGETSSNDQVLKYSQSDWNKMKQELELEYNAKILNKEKEWSKKLADRDKKISKLEDQSLQLRSANEDMKHVVAEFDKTISQLQAEKEGSSSESRNTFDDVIKERDQALEDLQSVETAFSDLHQRYERTKGVVEGLKKNEEILKKCVQDYQVKLKNAEDKAASVRQQAEEKLDLASMEMEKLRKSTTAEVARLEAALKKSDLKIQGLDRSLEQKVKENEELTSICDELIAKVGGE